MRVSRKKGFLRAIERLAGVQAVVAAATALLVLGGIVTAASAKPFVIVNFGLMAATFAVAVLLSDEFANLQRAGTSWWQRHRGLSSEQVKQLIQWCPRTLVYVSLTAATAGFIGMLMTGGRVHWSGEEFSSHHAIGFSLGTLVFCSVSLPVLASASRMPDDFEAHFGKGNEARI